MEGNSIERIYICLSVNDYEETLKIWLGWPDKEYYLCDMKEITRNEMCVLYKSDNEEPIPIPSACLPNGGGAFHLQTDLLTGINRILNIANSFDTYLFTEDDIHYIHCREIFPDNIIYCPTSHTISMASPNRIEVHFTHTLVIDNNA